MIVRVELAEDGGILIHGDQEGLWDLADLIRQVAMGDTIVAATAGEDMPVSIFRDEDLTV